MSDKEFDILELKAPSNDTAEIITEARRARESEATLLEALKLAAQILRTKRFEQGHLNEIKAAIAKAEGESEP